MFCNTSPPRYSRPLPIVCHTPSFDVYHLDTTDRHALEYSLDMDARILVFGKTSMKPDQLKTLGRGLPLHFRMVWSGKGAALGAGSTLGNFRPKSGK